MLLSTLSATWVSEMTCNISSKKSVRDVRFQQLPNPYPGQLVAHHEGIHPPSRTLNIVSDHIRPPAHLPLDRHQWSRSQLIAFPMLHLPLWRQLASICNHFRQTSAFGGLKAASLLMLLFFISPSKVPTTAESEQR
jgi:hypothetical protein